MIVHIWLLMKSFCDTFEASRTPSHTFARQSHKVVCMRHSSMEQHPGQSHHTGCTQHDTLPHTHQFETIQWLPPSSGDSVIQSSLLAEVGAASAVSCWPPPAGFCGKHPTYTICITPAFTSCPCLGELSITSEIETQLYKRHLPKRAVTIVAVPMQDNTPTKQNIEHPVTVKKQT